MAWSIFTQGGGEGAAASWSKQSLQLASRQWGANVDTPEMEQFVYDWEKSEGGGGKYNPLNQGPVPGQPQLTTTGQQYGGGAADFASIQAGLQGAVDYWNMPAYSGVKQAIMAGDAAAAARALWASPWAASHYGYGSNWTNVPLPGQVSSITGDTGAVPTTTDTSAGGAGVPGYTLTSSFGGGIFSGVLSYIFGPAAGLSDVGKIAQGIGTFLGVGGTDQPQVVKSNTFLSSLDELLNPSISLFAPWKAITMFIARGGFVLLGFMMILGGIYVLTEGTNMGRELVGEPLKRAAESGAMAAAL